VVDRERHSLSILGWRRVGVLDLHLDVVCGFLLLFGLKVLEFLLPESLVVVGHDLKQDLQRHIGVAQDGLVLHQNLSKLEVWIKVKPELDMAQLK
jgi:hypothetical protein